MSVLRKLQLAELEIFKEVIRICDKYNLTYYLLGGTLLGAVRHKGFIPWDDDIDIGLPRPDFERFLEVSEQELADKFKLESFTKNSNYLYYVPKIINKSIKLKDLSATIEKEAYAWIDIFPLDGMPKQSLVRKIHSFKLLIARVILNYSSFNSIVKIKLQKRPMHERILIYLGKILPVEKIFNRNKAMKRINRLLKRYHYEKSDYIVNFMGAYKFKEMFQKSYYGDGFTYEFEGLMTNGPKDYDFILTQMYGDYLTPPPKQERNKHFIQIIGKNYL